MPHEWREEDTWLRDWLQETAADESAGFAFISGHAKPLDVSASARKLLEVIENSVPFEVGDSIIRAIKYHATIKGFNCEQRLRGVTDSPEEHAMIDEAKSPIPLPIQWEGSQRRRGA
jgi:hypothetical protein